MAAGLKPITRPVAKMQLNPQIKSEAAQCGGSEVRIGLHSDGANFGIGTLAPRLVYDLIFLRET
jgi:hypothetical protein